MANYTIRDIESFTGIKAHTIRIWEKRFNLLSPDRTSTNIRHYSDDDLKKILNISVLQRNGQKISSIVKLNAIELSEKVSFISLSSHSHIDQIDSLINAMLDLDQGKFEKNLQGAIIKYGFEKTLVEIIYPLFEKIGLLWLDGSINPAYEHFVSNIIRQKIIVAIDSIADSHTNESKTFVLFLPEMEYHELGLLFYYYLLKINNHKVYYLGENVPYNGIVEIVDCKKIDYLLCSISVSNSLIGFEQYVSKLAKDFNDKKIFLTGWQVKNSKMNLPGNVFSIKDISSFKQHFLSLPK